MFESIKRAIWGRHDNSEPQTVASHHITENDQIASLLIQAFKAHTLFNAYFEEDENPFSTALLGIYEEYGFIVLDEINPASGHDRLLELGKVLLTGRVDGVELRFHCTLMEAREKNGVAYYKMNMPEKLFFFQRREDYRVPTRGTRIPFRAKGGYHNPMPLNGYLNDISRSGLGITLNDLVSIHRGEVINFCKITVPDGSEVIFSFEVCFSWRDTSRGLTRLGGRFQKIDRKGLQSIRKTINQMERAMAKRLHGID